MTHKAMPREPRFPHMGRRTAILAAACIFAGGAVIIGTVTGGASRIPFSGGDAGLQAAAGDSEEATVGDAITGEGITVRVEAILADGGQTALELEFDGLNAGESLYPAGRAYLLDENGNRYPTTHGGSAPGDPHHVSMSFPALPPGATSVSLVVPGFVRDPDLEGGTDGLGADWRFDLQIPRATSNDLLAAPLDAGAFGPGHLVIVSAVSGPTGVLVSGRIDGIEAATLVEVAPMPARLVNAAGVAMESIGGSLGVNDEPSAFTLRFPPLATEGLELTITFGRPPRPAVNEDAAAALEGFYGQQKTVQLTAP